MIFEKRHGRYVGVAKNGESVIFDGKVEMKACAEMRAKLLRLVGRIADAEACLQSAGECIRRGARFKVKAIWDRPMPKKIVRIYIDPDVEYIGNMGDTSFVTRGDTFPSRGRLKEKALA